MGKLIMPATLTGAWKEVTDAQLNAAVQALGDENAPTHDKPRFCVMLLLAVLDQKNGNKHFLSTEETQKAIDLLGDKQSIIGNFNHIQGDVIGASTRLWIDSSGEQNLLMLEGVCWNRQMSEDTFNNVMAQHRNQAVGASWEIDNFLLATSDDDPEAIVVNDFTLDGWALCVNGVQPAEAATTGQVQITAKLGDATEAQIERSTKHKIAIKDGGNIEKPHDDMSDSQYGDCVNYRYPMHPDHIEAEIQLFNKPEQREVGGYTSTEWAKIGNRIAKITGYRYKAGKLESAHTDVIRLSRFSDMPIDTLQAIRCPTCGERGVLKTLDFEKGMFVMECCNNEFDSDLISHRFEIAITVTPEGQKALQLVASEEESVGDVSESIRVMFKSVEEAGNNEEVFDVTEEEILQREKDAVERDRNARKAIEDDEAKIQAKIDAAVEERLVKERETAVEAYKASVALAAKRLDELGEIMPFETEADRVAASAKLAEMSDESFEGYKENRQLRAEVAELKAVAEVDPVDLVALAAERVSEAEKIMPFEGDADKAAASEKLAGMSDEDFTSYKEARVLEAKKDPTDVIVATLDSGEIDPDDMSWASRV